MLRTVYLWAPALAALGLAACATEAPTASTATAAPAAVHSLHASSPLPVRIEWDAALGAFLRTTDSALFAELANQTDGALEVDVYAYARIEELPALSFLGTHALQPGEVVPVELPVKDVPLQAHNDSYPIKLLAVIDRPGQPVQIPSADLHVSFNQDYTRAFASSLDALGPDLAAELGGEVGHSALKLLLDRAADRALSRHELHDITRAMTDEHLPLTGRIRSLGESWQPLAALEAAQAVLPRTGARKGRTDFEISPRGPFGGRPPPVFSLFQQAQICVSYDVHFTDSNLGEDYLVDGFWMPGVYGRPNVWVPLPKPARFAALAVVAVGADPHVAFSSFLDENGCAEVSLWPGREYKLVVNTYLRRGSSDYDIRYVYPKAIDQHCDTTTLRGFVECQTSGTIVDYLKVARTADRSTARVHISSRYDSHALRIAAVAGQLLANPDHGLKSGVEPYLVWANTGSPRIIENGKEYRWAEAGADTVAYFGNSIGIGAKDTTLEKFVVAHELGHQLQFRAKAYKQHDYYVMTSNVPQCRCDHVQSANKIHCLQSRHSWGAAFAEGWAHFVAARTFNNPSQADCRFTYYKEFLWDDGQVQYPPVGVACVAPRSWTRSHCPAPNESSELDMLGFLTAVDRDPTVALSMEELYAIIRDSSSPQYWSSFSLAARDYLGADNPRYDGILRIAAQYGVDG